MRAWRIVSILALILCGGLYVVFLRNEPAPAARDVEAETVAGPLASADPAPSVEPDTTPSGTLRGRLIDALSSEPIKQFDVEFHAFARKAEAESPGVRSFRSEDGRFEWPGLGARTWTITAIAPGYQRFEIMQLEIPQGGTTQEIVMPLRRGHVLRGRVYDEATGVGIAGAHLAFREANKGPYEGNFRMRRRITTGKGGAFTFDGLPPGRVALQIHAEGYAGDERIAVANETALLEIGLSPGGTIAGRVVQRDGVTPIAGNAGIEALDRGWGTSYRVDESGEFEFRNLSPGRYRIHGDSAAGAASPQEFALAKNQQVRGLMLVMNAGRSIRGVVSGLRAEERSNARVSAWPLDDRGIVMSMPSSEVDEQGAFAVHGVRPGKVRLQVSLPMRNVSKIVEVPADADLTVDLDIPAGARLSGRVTRAGRPMANVWLEAAPAEAGQTPIAAMTSTTGEYVMEGLTDGTEYRVRAATYAVQTIHLAGDRVLNFDVPAGKLTGRLLQESGSIPVVSADVQLWPAGPQSPRIHLHDRTDHFGSFELAGLEPGDYLLTAYRPGYEMLRERVTFSASVADMTLRVRADPGVELRARDGRGLARLDSLLVMGMVGEADGIGVHVDLDENGVGYLPGALTGSRLTISAWNYEAVVIDAWDGQPLDLRLEPKP